MTGCVQRHPGVVFRATSSSGTAASRAASGAGGHSSVDSWCCTDGRRHGRRGCRGGGQMRAEEVVALYTLLDDHGVRLWVDGGWGIDALLAEQTRPHKDLDVLAQ